MKPVKRFFALVVIGMLLTSCATSVDEEETKPHGPGTPGTPTTPIPSDPTVPTPSTPGQPIPSDPEPPLAAIVVPSISLMVPTSGKAGTEVTIRGRNLENTKQVCFATQCTVPTSVTADTITVKAPDMTGAVLVGVDVEGTHLTAGLFNYLSASLNHDDVDWCQLMYVSPAIKENEPIIMAAQVYEEGITGSGAPHSGIMAQMGYHESGKASLDEFSWIAVQRNTAFGELASMTNDEYRSETSLPLKVGDYQVVARFSLNGRDWLYCDLNGSGDGFDMAMSARVKVVGKNEEAIPDKSIGWCRIMNGNTSISSQTGELSESIYAQVYVDGCTGEKGSCGDVKAQVGYGPSYLATISSIDSGYTWTNAALNPAFDKTTAADNDEYMAQIKTNEPGSYLVVYRMSVDNGKTWTYCDTSDDLYFTVADAMTWTVSQASTVQGDPNPVQEPSEDPNHTTPATIEWCRLHAPQEIVVVENKETEMVYGRAFVKGCTDSSTGCSSLEAELGYGPKKGNLESDFKYVKASYNPNAYDVGMNDEFMAALKPDKAGKYALVYRFSLDKGKTWTYCDYDDESGFDMNKTASLEVKAVNALKIGWCQLYSDDITIVKGEQTSKLYGQAYVETCTEEPGACEQLSAYVGYGKPTDALDKFAFIKASFEKQVGQNDEYTAVLKPKEVGDFEVIYAFSLDGGETKTYCGNVDEQTFKRSHAVKMSVIESADSHDGETFTWEEEYACGIPDAFETVSDIKANSEALYYGQIWIKGCTENQTCSNVVGAHLHYIEQSKNIKDPSKWKEKGGIEVEAALNEGCPEVNNDEYIAKHAIAKPGKYYYAYSFDLKRNPGDYTENAQRVYCYIHWDQKTLGTVVVEN